MSQTIGSFILIKNDIAWIKKHLKLWLPWLDEMVFFDGNSTDGTLQVLEDFLAHDALGHKIKLYRDKDPKNLEDAYVEMFNDAINMLSTDFAFFLHPDMLPIGGAENLRKLDDSALAYFTSMESFAGDSMDSIYLITKGRAKKWKNIMRRRNPDLGLHYFGHYGVGAEDMYFRDITQDQHFVYADMLDKYPYPVLDSGMTIAHYSDVRPYERRLSRMAKCLENQGRTPEKALEEAKSHARVTLKDNEKFEFKGPMTLGFEEAEDAKQAT